MGLKQTQEQVDTWISQFKGGYWKPHEIFARLGEEVGEVGREINHLFGPKPKKPSEDTHELGAEIADVIFTLCCLANSQKINLDEAFDTMMKEKLYGRDQNRFERKEA